MFEAHLHPFLSSFPFVLLTLTVAAECYSIVNPQGIAKRYIFIHLLLAVVMIVSAFLSGYVAAPQAHTVLGRSEEEISYHHLWGKAVLILSIATLALQWISERAKYNKQIFVLLFRVSLVSLWLLAMTTGYFGGKMLLSAPVRESVSHLIFESNSVAFLVRLGRV